MIEEAEEKRVRDVLYANIMTKGITHKVSRKLTMFYNEKTKPKIHGLATYHASPLHEFAPEPQLLSPRSPVSLFDSVEELSESERSQAGSEENRSPLMKLTAESKKKFE